MKSYAAAHAQSETVLPEPLAGVGVWNVGARALPAVMLSVCSAAVFALVLLFLRLGRAYELFVLQFPGTAIIGAIAAALSWGVAAKCRRRPGRLWPRIWALVLACLNSVIALLGLVFPDRSWALALAVAGLAAAATLAPRLVKLRPDNPMVQWVAPISLLMILLVILPTSCVVRRTITSKTEQRVEQRIQQFRLWTLEVKEATGFDWERMEQNPDAAAKAVARLKQLHFQEQVDDAEVWRSAAVLGKDRELATAMRGLTAQIVAGLEPQRVPRVSQLHEAAIRWDSQEKRWESYSQFATLSDVTGSYYQELGRLFGELASQDTSVVNSGLVDYKEDYGTQRDALQNHLKAVATTWADNWAPYRVPEYVAFAGRQHAPLGDVLRASFIESEGVSLVPGQLWQLTTLPLHRLKTMARGSPGCEGGESVEGDTRRRAPGCHCQSYVESGREYFRLDCYSYSPRKEGTGAELRVEMRLVYQSPASSWLSRPTLPAEIFFHDIERGDISVRVTRPIVVPLAGLTPEPQALLVRVVRTPSVRRQLTGG